MDEVPTMEALLNGLGIDDTSAEEETESTSAEDTETGTEENSESVDTTDETSVETSSEETPAPKQQMSSEAKQREAFIYLRQQNQKQNDMLKRVADMVGLDVKTLEADKLMEALQNKVDESQAQKQNIPVEVVKRLQILEEHERERNLITRRENLASGYRAVQEKYKLTDKELESFSTELLESGKNPFTETLDLEAEYLKLNHDRILKKRIDEAVAAEQARAAKAGAHGSNPGKSRGKGDTSGDGKISSIEQLESWMRDNI